MFNKIFENFKNKFESSNSENDDKITFKKPVKSESTTGNLTSNVFSSNIEVNEKPLFSRKATTLSSEQKLFNDLKQQFEDLYGQFYFPELGDDGIETFKQIYNINEELNKELSNTKVAKTQEFQDLLKEIKDVMEFNKQRDLLNATNRLVAVKYKKDNDIISQEEFNNQICVTGYYFEINK